MELVDLKWIDHAALKKSFTIMREISSVVAQSLFNLTSCGFHIAAKNDLAEITPELQVFGLTVAEEPLPKGVVRLLLVNDRGPISRIFGTFAFRQKIAQNADTVKMCHIMQILLAFYLRMPCFQVLPTLLSENLLEVLYCYGYVCEIYEHVQIVQAYGKATPVRVKNICLISAYAVSLLK